MFNILVSTEYKWLFEILKTEASKFFSMKLADFSCPDENQYEQLARTDAIIGQKINLAMLNMKLPESFRSFKH